MRAALFAGVVLSIGVAAAVCRWPAAGAAGGPALDQIRASDVAAHLAYLSSDALEGRGPASRGGRQAAAYLAAQLRRVGFEPAGDGGTFLQHVPLVETRVDSADLQVGDGPALVHPADIVMATDRMETRVGHRGGLVFVGFGIVAPEYGWDDYGGVDVRGKVVVALVGEPQMRRPGGFAGPALSYYGRWTYKLEEAARRGAAGALLVHTNESAAYDWTVVQHSWTGEQFTLPAPPTGLGLAFKGWVSERAARALLAAAGADLDTLRRAARRPGAATRPLGVDARARLEQHVRPAASANVVGVLRGTSPDEAVVYTAHYDHLGVRQVHAAAALTRGDQTFNGAVDNGSGVAGLLEVADALARAPRPRRSIYVVFTTAEESDLAGAVHFVRHPPVPVTAMAAAINLDVLNLVGRSHDAVLLGAERSSLGSVAAALARRQGRELGADPDPGSGAYFRSDHYPFAVAGVPAVAVGMPSRFSTPDPEASRRAQAHWFADLYHQPGDEFRPDFDYTGAVLDLQLVAMLGWSVAAEPSMPAYHAGQPFAQIRDRGAP